MSLACVACPRLKPTARFCTTRIVVLLTLPLAQPRPSAYATKVPIRDGGQPRERSGPHIQTLTFRHTHCRLGHGRGWGGGIGNVKRAVASSRHLYWPGPSRHTCAALIVGTMTGLAGLLGGCASNGSDATAALPSLPSLPKVALPESPPPIVGSATEVYERIGRGAMACWFGADGFLKSTHIYDAMAEPAHQGGKAEILIRERDTSGGSPRGLKAFRILITPSGSDETNVVAENFKLPEPMAAKMKKNVAAWSIGDQGCDPNEFNGAWQAKAANPAKADGGASKQKTTQPKQQVAKEKP